MIKQLSLLLLAFVFLQSYGGTGLDQAQDITKTNDGNYVLVGETSSSNFPMIDHKGNTDLVVIKIN